MGQPVQLRYTDTSDTEQVIGTYLTDDNLIQQAQLKNSGSGEYTRMEVIGDKQLSDNLPIDYTSYGTAEPEIRVYVRDSGSWKLRDRVFAEQSGVLDDQGKYRNDELWGFQKWVGRQKTPSKVNLSGATITQIIDSLLPSGYVAETPSGDTVPTVENYTYTGKLDQAFRDIIRDYPVKIWFTAKTDGSGNYIVKVQSKGFGGVVQSVEFSDERKTSGYQIIEFDEEDKSNIINRVEVEGVDSNGQKINVDTSNFTSGTLATDIQNSIDNHGERYIHRSVGYLESVTQAENLAKDILSLQASPHAVMSVGFINENALNSSIDVLDDRFGIDAVYTIVKQRDFFTEGKTEVELSFEKNAAESRRDSDRDLNEQNHQLFPTSTQDVGGQSLDTNNSNTTNASADVSTSIDNEGSELIVDDAETETTAVQLDSTSFTDITSDVIEPIETSAGCYVSVTLLGENALLGDLISEGQNALTDSGTATVTTDSGGQGSQSISFNESFTSTPGIVATADIQGTIVTYDGNNTDSNGSKVFVDNGPTDGSVSVNWIASQPTNDSFNVNGVQDFEIELRVKRNGTVVLPDDDFSYPVFTARQLTNNNAVTGSLGLFVPILFGKSDEIRVEARLVSSVGYESSMSVDYTFLSTYHFSDVPIHNHGADTGDAGHGDPDNTSDNSFVHNLEGITMEELVNLINEDKTDR